MTRRPASRRRRPLVVVGLLLVATGVGLLGWVGWQFWGTNWVSHRHQREVLHELERSWRSGGPEPVTDFGTAEAIVRIPAFGDDYAVPVLEGGSDGVLAAGFGHLSGTADAGQVGNYAIAAHRVTHGEPLRDLPSLEPGDLVVVETRDATYTYELSTGGDDLTVPFTAGWVLATHPANPDPDGVEPPDAERLITLTTCADLFHTDDRLVAFGRLVGTEPR